MRWIVISLLLINALIFGWRWFGPEAEPAVSTEPVEKVAAAHAIELLADELIDPDASKDSAEQQPLLAEASPATTEIPPLTTETPPEVTGLAPDSTPAESNGPELAAAAAGTPDPAPAGVVTPNTVSASSAAVTRPAATIPAQAAAASKSLDAGGHCAWTDWAAKLPALAPDTESLMEQQREFETGRSYLVYIPGKGSREQTLERLAEVKTLGVEAAFLNKGPQAGGISLGLFSKPESMQIRLKQLKDADVTDARGLERVRTEPQSRRLLRWTGEKTPTSVQNQALISCNEIAPAAT